MKKGWMMMGLCSLFLLGGCGGSVTENETKAAPSNVQVIDEVDASVTKFYDKNTKKLVYGFNGYRSSGVAMVDGNESETISTDFLEIIEIKELTSLDMTLAITRDKDNGNILIISDGYRSGSIAVQKPTE